MINKLRDNWIYMFLSIIGSMGMTGIFTSSFSLKMLKGFDVIYFVILSCILFILYSFFSEKKRLYVMAGLLISEGFIAGVMFRNVSESMVSLIDEINKVAVNDDFAKPDIAYTMIATGLVIVFVYLVLSKYMMAAIAEFASLLVISLMFNCIPKAFYLVLFIIFVLTEVMLKKNPKDKFYPMVTALTLMIAFGILVLFIPEKRGEDNFIKRMFSSIFTTEDNEKLTAAGGVSGGELGQVDSVETKNVKMLTLMTGNQGTIYLRGYVGSVYKNNSWNELDSESYNGKSDLFTKRDIGFEVYNQQAAFFRYAEKDEELIKSLFSSLDNYMSNVSKRKYSLTYEKRTDTFYWYLPYGNEYFSSGKSSYDGYPTECDTGKIYGTEYSNKFSAAYFNVIKAVVDSYSGDVPDFDKYVRWEKRYRDFVYKNYTVNQEKEKQSTSHAVNEIKSELNNLDYDGNAQYKVSVIEAVRKYLNENYTYTLSPGAIPSGRDFVDVFLNEKKAGYCTHFATAGTVLLREFGIPARYVSGYLVDTSRSSDGFVETSQLNICGKTVTDTYRVSTVDVMDSDAHAWVEVYMDGFGWIPVEFTPGYNNNVIIDGDRKIIENSQNEGDSDGLVNSGNLESDDEKGGDTPLNTDVDNDGIAGYAKPEHFYSFSQYFEYLGKSEGIIEFDIVWGLILDLLIKILHVIGIVAAIIFVIGLMLVIAREISFKKVKRLLSVNKGQTPEEDSAQIIDLYRYFTRLCTFLGVPLRKDLSYEEHVRLVEEKFDCFKECDVRNIITPAEKISFGRGNIGMKEMGLAVDTGIKLRRSIYDRQSKVKRLIFKYIYHL